MIAALVAVGEHGIYVWPPYGVLYVDHYANADAWQHGADATATFRIEHGPYTPEHLINSVHKYHDLRQKDEGK